MGFLLDFDTAMAEQADLDRLCRSRNHPNREIYWPNENYGFSTVLKRYSGYPNNEPIHAVIPHGVYLNIDRKAFGGEAAAPVPAVLSYPEYLDTAFRRSTRKHVIPSAAPFLYALELAKEVRQTPERKGTMFFPAHSTACVAVEAPHEQTAKMLLDLPDEYQPVTLCVHWHDYGKGMHKPYAKRGMRVVSAGHNADQRFLFRLIHLMSTCRYAASNSLGSNAFYAMAMDIPYFLLDVKVKRTADKNFERAKPSDKRRAEKSRLRKMLLKLPPVITPELTEATRYHLGRERFKTPDSLLMDLLYAKQLGRRR